MLAFSRAFDPFWLLVIVLMGFVVGLAPWVLFRRRDPPLLLLVAVGLCAGGPRLVSDLRAAGELWAAAYTGFDIIGAMWLLLSVIWGLSVLVQPAGRGEPRPAADRLRLLRWFLPTLACVALASALLVSLGGGACAAFLGLPLLVSSLLSLYDTERVRRVRRGVAWLQFGTAAALAANYIPLLLWTSLAGWRDLSTLAGLLLWGLLAPLPVAVLWALGPRVRGAGWIVGMLVAASLLGVGRVEWLTRTQRALLHLDLSDLPSHPIQYWRPPRGPLCIETPTSRCPEGTEPLWVWPADVPIGDRVLGRSGAVLFSDAGKTGEIPIGTPSGRSGGLVVIRDRAEAPVGASVVRLGDGAYRVAGLRVEGTELALAAISAAERSCGADARFEPDPGWTAQELVTLCEHGCTYEPGPHRCEQDEVLGWVTRCEPGEVCTIVDGTVGTCEQGGCTVDGGGRAVELSCRGGGCTVSNATAVKCTEGDCTTRP